jgi:pimeloyl-ACP methyl ester carboxylesterase
MLTEKTFDTGAVVLNYAEGPAAGPPLVLLHGITTAWQAWMPLLPALMLRWQVFALDLRGHGKSGRVSGRYRLEDYVADLASFLVKQVESPAVVIGHSLGGLAAIGAAIPVPDHIRAIVVADSPMYRESYLDRVDPAYDPALRDLAASGRSVDEIAARFAELRICTPGTSVAVRQADIPGNDAAFLRFRARCLAQTDPEALQMIIDGRALHEPDLDLVLSQVRCPVLLLQADPFRGAFLTDRDVARILAILPQASHVKFAGIGHQLHMENPAPVLRALAFFLESLR